MAYRLVITGHVLMRDTLLELRNLYASIDETDYHSWLKPPGRVDMK